jgi:hypothetical protein
MFSLRNLMMKSDREKKQMSHRLIWICNLFLFFLDRASPIPHLAGIPLADCRYAIQSRHFGVMILALIYGVGIP